MILLKKMKTTKMAIFLVLHRSGDRMLFIAKQTKNRMI